MIDSFANNATLPEFGLSYSGLLVGVGKLTSGLPLTQTGGTALAALASAETLTDADRNSQFLRNAENSMATDKYPEHKALNPFFDVVMKGLKGLVDADHYYDAIAEDAQFEFLYRFPGWAEVIHGRDNLIAAYSSYGNNIVLEKGDGLAVHHDKERGVVTLEYQVHGKALKTGAAYDNRFVSIVTIKNRQIVSWRDYMDSLAAWQALTGK